MSKIPQARIYLGFFVQLREISFGQLLFIRRKLIGTSLASLLLVFHRILDFKTGCISMLALFYLVNDQPYRGLDSAVPAKPENIVLHCLSNCPSAYFGKINVSCARQPKSPRFGPEIGICGPTASCAICLPSFVIPETGSTT